MAFSMGLLGLSTAPAALGCGYHALPEVQLTGMYPGSLSVAVALRKAADNGVIDAAALELPGSDGAGYTDAVQSLHAFKNAIAASPAAANLPARFSLGYVESRLWSRYSQAGGKVHADVHTDGPAQGEAVVLTGEPVVMELLARRLSIERALTDGTVRIDGDDSDRAAIRHALEVAFDAPRLSSR